jgi:hypothetical protein
MVKATMLALYHSHKQLCIQGRYPWPNQTIITKDLFQDKRYRARIVIWLRSWAQEVHACVPKRGHFGVQARNRLTINEAKSLKWPYLLQRAL